MDLEFKKIVSLINEKKFNEAIYKLDPLIDKKPLEFKYHYIKGIANLNLQETDKAIKSFDNAIKIDDNSYLSYHFRGILNLNKAEYKNAISDFDKIIHIKPDFPEAYNNLGIVYYYLGQNDEAIENFLKAINLKDNYIQAQNNLVEILTQTQKIKEQDSKIISTHNYINKKSFEYSSKEFIKDEEIKKIFTETNNIIKTNIKDIEFNETQIYRRIDARLKCDRHKKIFNKYNVIPEYCFGCFKVQIEPASVLDLIKLYIIFDHLDLNNIKKCMIELRPNISGKYKGIIYCKSLTEAEQIHNQLNILISQNFKKIINSNIKRGCSEFAVNFPQYKNLDNDIMHYDQEWKKFENLIDERFPDLNFDKKFRSTIKGISLADILIIRNWLHYARMIGDNSYKIISTENFKSVFLENKLKALGY